MDFLCPLTPTLQSQKRFAFSSSFGISTSSSKEEYGITSTSEGRHFGCRVPRIDLSIHCYEPHLETSCHVLKDASSTSFGTALPLGTVERTVLISPDICRFDEANETYPIARVGDLVLTAAAVRACLSVFPEDRHFDSLIVRISEDYFKMSASSNEILEWPYLTLECAEFIRNRFLHYRTNSPSIEPVNSQGDSNKRTIGELFHLPWEISDGEYSLMCPYVDMGIDCMESCLDNLEQVITHIWPRDSINWYSVNASTFILNDLKFSLGINWSTPKFNLTRLETVIFSCNEGNISICSILMAISQLDGKVFLSLRKTLCDFISWYISVVPNVSSSVQYKIDEYSVRLCRVCRLPVFQCSSLGISTARVQRLSAVPPTSDHISQVCSLTLSSKCRSPILRTACLRHLAAIYRNGSHLLSTSCAQNIYTFLITSLRYISYKGDLIPQGLERELSQRIELFFMNFPQWDRESVLFSEYQNFSAGLAAT